MKQGQALVIGFCLFAVVASAVGVAYAKYASRKQFVALQALRAERDALEVEWGRLQLEQSTWATHGRVERIARDKLNMRTPNASEVVVVTP